MRNLKQIVPILLLSIVTACGSTKKESDALTIRPEKVTPKIEGLLVGTMEREVISNREKDTASYKVDFAFFLDVAVAWKDSVNQFLGEHLFDITNADDRLKYSYQLVNMDFYNNQLDAFEANYRSVDEYTGDHDFVWEINGTNKVDTLSLKNFVQVYSFYSFFTGGAHPNSSSMYKVFDKKNGKILTWQQAVNDTIAFEKIFVEEFKKQREIKSEKQIADQYFFENNTIVPSNNFEVKNDHLIFYYNPYEIAPYAEGLVKIQLPIKAVQKLLVIN